MSHNFNKMMNNPSSSSEKIEEPRKHATQRVGRAKEEQTKESTKSTKRTRKHEKEFDKCETKATNCLGQCRDVLQALVFSLFRAFVVKSFVFFILIFLWVLSFAQTGIEIIDQVDKNMVSNTAEYRAKMVISLGGQVREKEFNGYIQGKDKAHLEFTAPARDKGTRFLKIGDEMWIYLPEVEKATKIAGHMLRQSLMGSDFSYDDMTGNEKLKELYEIELIGMDTVMDKPCYLLELTAKAEEVSYYQRKLWIDKNYKFPVKEELYAKSGKLMKETTITDFKKIGERNYPTRIKMVNKLRQNTYTELVLEDVKLDIQIPDRIFTKSYLERK